MTAPILILAGLLAAAALAIWQVRRPPWESKRLRRQVEREAAQIPEATIDPETRARLLPPKASERWRELAKAEVGYTIGAVGGAVEPGARKRALGRPAVYPPVRGAGSSSLARVWDNPDDAAYNSEGDR
jgi:hypothetical protein